MNFKLRLLFDSTWYDNYLNNNNNKNIHWLSDFWLPNSLVCFGKDKDYHDEIENIFSERSVQVRTEAICAQLNFEPL